MSSSWGGSWGSSWGNSWGTITGDPSAPVVGTRPTGKTYLELCQILRSECSVSGVGPVTVLNQTGLLQKICRWISVSYIDIQLRYPNWNWMRAEFTLPTVADESTYPFWDCTDVRAATPITRFANWINRDARLPFKIYKESDGVASEQYLLPLEYERFRDIYIFGGRQQVPGRPVNYSVTDDEQLIFGPTPDDVYIVTGHYQRGPQVLTLDADEPDFPLRFHDLIVYYAMERYATNSVAPEMLARGALEGGRLLRALEQNQLPQIRLGRPLV